MDQPDRRYLRQQFPEFDWNMPLVMAECQPDLQEYFTFYGFAQLLEQRPCQYFSGQKRLGGGKCILHCWEPVPESPKEPKTAVIAHGLFDHTGLYLKLVSSLIDAGITVVMTDLPGHGLSEGEPATIDRFGTYANVIADVVLLLQPHTERFGRVSLLGQSTGGAAILWFLLDRVDKNEIHRVILLAPLLRPARYRWIQWAFPLFQLLGITPRRHFKPNSGDKAFCEFLKNGDELQTHHVPLLWVRAMLEWVSWFEQQRLHIGQNKKYLLEPPLLVVQGDCDRVVEWRYNLARITDIFKTSEEVIIEGAQHHLVNESPKFFEKIITPVIHFLD